MINKIKIKGNNQVFASGLINHFNGMGYNASSDREPSDMFIYIVDPLPCNLDEYDNLLGVYQNTALDMLREVSEALPGLDGGSGKRICFITRLDSSINMSDEIKGGGERVVSAACNMAIKTLFNRLRPLGYTFRLYGLKDFNTENEYSYISEYFLFNRSFEEGAPFHSDENRIVIRDKYEKEYPW